MLPCVCGMCQEDAITCPITWRAFAQLQLSAPCAVYHASLAAPPAHQAISQRAFVCSAVSQIPATAFLPSTPKPAGFSCGLSYAFVKAHVSKGWNKPANHFMTPDSLLQPQRHLFFFILGGRPSLLFLHADCSFCWSIMGLFSASSWIFGPRDQGLLCDLSIFCLLPYLFIYLLLAFLWLLPMPLLFLSFSHRFAEPWAMHALRICFSSLSIIPPCLR